MNNYQIPPPANWQDFERLCHSLWMDLLKDPNTQLHGRQGQAQHGVDVYGTDFNSGMLTCIQCKGKARNYGKQLSAVELRREVKKALKFSPNAPDIFIVATTAPNDSKIQMVARQISDEHQKNNLFEVIVCGWDDLCLRIITSENCLEQFYPNLASTNKATLRTLGSMVTQLARIEKKLSLKDDIVDCIKNADDAKRIFLACSSGLLNWPRTLKINNRWIAREEENIYMQLRSTYFSSTIILGEPGTGKSALLSTITQSIIYSNGIVLGIKADQLDSGVCDFESLSESLELPDRIDRCLLAASKYGNTFLVIDQLDTLSELVDVNTRRLSVLLNLIKKLNKTPNIHILASSRPFEFKYDVRLSSIDAKQIQLQSLSWETVERISKEFKIKFKNANQPFRAFLCKPSNLNFYLQYVRDNPQKVFLSNIELYDHMWAHSLGKNAIRQKRSELLINIAQEMTDAAKQILPIVKFDKFLPEIDWLVDSGYLLKSANNKSVAFAHQTLQAFVWVISFITQNQNLSDFVFSHQESLNVRPKLSTALFYLREADMKEYNEQLTRLLRNEFINLRKHIQHLVIECICAQHEPNKTEVKLITMLFNDDQFIRVICKNISGKVYWFDALRQYHLPKAMQASDFQKISSTIVLSNVHTLRSEYVQKLIEKYWQKENGLNYLYKTLQGIHTWNEEILNIAKYLVTQDNVNEFVASHITQVIAETNVNLAIRFAAYYFKHRLNILINAVVECSIPVVEVYSEIDQINSVNVNVQFETLLNFSTSWHFIPKLVEFSPKEFIDEFWDFFCLGCKYSTNNWDKGGSYPEAAGLWFQLSDERGSSTHLYFCIALEAAIKAFAKNNVEAFLQFFNREKEKEFGPVHRILSKGLEAISQTHAELGVLYLLEDARRLKLGSALFGNTFCGTQSLILAIFIHLDLENRLRLEDAILSYKARSSNSLANVEEKRRTLMYNRSIVSLLLNTVPRALLSEKGQLFLTREKRIFGNPQVEYFGGYSGMVGQESCMTFEQMIKASNSDILGAFNEYNDNKGLFVDPQTYYGNSALTRVFETFSEKYPSRAEAIILKLDKDNMLAVTSALDGISKSSVSLDHLLDLITKLENRGFKSREFYTDVVPAIARKIDGHAQLTEHWCLKLESFIVHEDLLNDMDTSSLETDKTETIRSILWGHGRGIILPHGNFTLLVAITDAYLNRKIPAVGPWIAFVKRQIKNKIAFKTIDIFLGTHVSRWLFKCDSDDAEEIVDLLIQNYPQVVQTTNFAYLVAYALHWASEKKLIEWINNIRTNSIPLTSQITGELLGLMLKIRPDCKFSKQLIIDEVNNKDDFDFLVGVAFSLTNLWEDIKEQINPLIIQLLDIQDVRLSNILLRIINQRDKLELSIQLGAVLDALILNSTLEMPNEGNAFVPESLCSIVDQEPHRVAKLCNQIINSQGAGLGDVSRSASIGTQSLITIAITLHNSGPDFQGVGLNLFERLLDLDVYQIHEALQSIDDIPQVTML